MNFIATVRGTLLIALLSAVFSVAALAAYAAFFSRAPAGTMPFSRNFHNAISSFLASATMPVPVATSRTRSAAPTSRKPEETIPLTDEEFEDF